MPSIWAAERRKPAKNKIKEKPKEERMDCQECIARVTSHIPDKGRAEMIRKIYEVDPLLCPPHAEDSFPAFLRLMMRR